MNSPGQNKVILEIMMPKNSEETPEAMLQIFSSLATSKSYGLISRLLFGKQPMITSFELVTYAQRVHLYVVTTNYYQSYIESLFTAQYPKILITQVKDYLETFLSSRFLASGQLKLSTSYYYPLHTYRDYKDVDPLSGALGTMAKTKGEEKMLIQVIVVPAGSGWQKKAASIVAAGVKDPETGYKKALPQGRLIEQKIAFNGMQTGIRLLCAASDAGQTISLLNNLAGSFGAFNSGEGNQLMLNRPLSWQKKGFLQSIINRSAKFIPGHQVLNVSELASIWHPPGKLLSGIRNINWGFTYGGEAPLNLPVAIDATEEEKKEINFFARTSFKNQDVVFGIKRPDRRRHVYIIGKTGTGKSTLIANMAINDMRNGEGVAVIDPHGDLSDILLDYVPSFRINDVVYLDPSDTANPFWLNPLEVKQREYAELVASGIVAIFYKLYYYSWGPRLEYILRNTIMTLLEVPNSTLTMVPELLANDTFRQRITKNLKDKVQKNFWENEFAKMSDKLRSEAIAPIQNKVGQFISSPTIRQILDHPKSTIDLEDIMNSGKILILNLCQGKLGEDNSALLGAMFITKLQLAAMSRVNVPEDKRRDFYLYVDEFQNFATTSFIKILSEARKYRLNLTLANQYIGQVIEDVQKAIFGNTGTLLSFLVGAADARLLYREFGGVYEEEELVQLGNYQIIIKLAIDDLTGRPFYGKTLPLPRSRNKNRPKVIRVSRQRYTRPTHARTPGVQQP